jgi:hypothetical protein
MSNINQHTEPLPWHWQEQELNHDTGQLKTQKRMKIPRNLEEKEEQENKKETKREKDEKRKHSKKKGGIDQQEEH